MKKTGRSKKTDSRNSKSSSKGVSGRGTNRRDAASDSRGSRPSHSNKNKGNSGPAKVPKDVRLVPGFHSVNEAMVVRASSVQSMWVRKDWESVNELRSLLERAEACRIRVEEKSMQELDRYVTGHQGVIALVGENPVLNWERLKVEKSTLLLALDGIEDPHNLGAILRTAWLMGAEGLFVPENRSVQLSPAANKVASGGAEHVPVQVETNLPSLLKSLKDLGFWVFGLSHKAEKNFWQIEFPEKVVWVIGSESKGLRVPTEKMCDELVSIPQLAAGASYNASVAAAMAMAETRRQWRQIEPTSR